jgi:hypothetical protein
VSHKAPLGSHKRTFEEFLVEVAFLNTTEKVLHIWSTYSQGRFEHHKFPYIMPFHTGMWSTLREFSKVRTSTGLLDDGLKPR